MRHEKTQKGNPHNLVLKQHIFPAKSIERFVDACGTVAVFYKDTCEQIKLKPEDKLFCARRAWDEKAETGYMKKIEDSFQALASRIVADQVRNLEGSENRLVSDFFALWELRFDQNLNPINDIELKGILPGKPFTKNEEEVLEKSNLVFARDKVIPNRFMNSLNIKMRIGERSAQMRNLKWGIVSSFEGEFIVPDNFSNNAILPVSPKVVLLGDSKNLIIPRSEVIKVNQKAISSSNRYYFAKNLSNCPI